jgi:hypothetical protein
MKTVKDVIAVAEVMRKKTVAAAAADVVIKIKFLGKPVRGNRMGFFTL